MPSFTELVPEAAQRGKLCVVLLNWYQKQLELLKRPQLRWLLLQVDSHPFDVNKMLFMDWRDSHLHGHKELMEANSKLPTFLYAMPFSANHIFLGQFASYLLPRNEAVLSLHDDIRPICLILFPFFPLYTK